MPPKNELTRQWLQRALDDLRMAHRVLDPPVVPNAACFHAQQLTEKALKAFLQWQEIPSAKVHDIRRLLALCVAQDSAFEELRGSTEWLPAFAVDARYPGGPEPTEKLAREAVGLAETVYKLALDRLPAEVRP